MLQVLFVGGKGASVAIIRESQKHRQFGETGGPGVSPDGDPVREELQGR